MKEQVYGVYRGEEFLDVGTAKELSKTLGLPPHRIRNMASPSNLKKDKPGSVRMVAVRVG